MTIFTGSRYRNVNRHQVDLGDETDSVFELRETTVAAPAGLRAYVTKAEDTFESLAYELFGDANKWYVLSDLNPQVFWPLDLVPGTKIVVPTKEYAALA